jgi:hypothetical protein
MKKNQISFYYVLGAGKPAPTVPSDQGVYQLLWDALDRSNCSLKQPPPRHKAIKPQQEELNHQPRVQGIISCSDITADL